MLLHTHTHTTRDEERFLCCSDPPCFLNIFACLIYKFLLEFPTSADFSISPFIATRFLCKYFEVLFELDYFYLLFWGCIWIGLTSQFMTLFVNKFYLIKREAWCSAITGGLCHKLQICWIRNMFENCYYVDTWQITGDEFVLLDGRMTSNLFVCSHCPPCSLEHRVVKKWLPGGRGCSGVVFSEYSYSNARSGQLLQSCPVPCQNFDFQVNIWKKISFVDFKNHMLQIIDQTIEKTIMIEL